MNHSPLPSSRRVWLFRSIALLALVGLPPATLQAQTCDDVSGTWTVDLTLPGTGTSTVTLVQDECVVTGMVEGRNQTPVTDGTVEGATATFTAMARNEADGSGLAVEWVATVDGDDIAGTLSSPLMGTLEFTGRRADG